MIAGHIYRSQAQETVSMKVALTASVAACSILFIALLSAFVRTEAQILMVTPGRLTQFIESVVMLGLLPITTNFFVYELKVVRAFGNSFSHKVSVSKSDF